MKERPILWSPAMISAIMNTQPGTEIPTAIDSSEPIKVETRRIVTHRTGKTSAPVPTGFRRGMIGHGTCLFRGPSFDAEAKAPAAVGDRLWGRERWAVSSAWDRHPPRDLPGPVGPERPDGIAAWYDADGPVHSKDRGRWRPGMFMPRSFSRILHEVTSVEVQHLQDMPPESVRLEGFVPADAPPPESADVLQPGWDQINGHRPGCSWSANPWVWVIGLKRLEVPGAVG